MKPVITIAIDEDKVTVTRERLATKAERANSSLAVMDNDMAVMVDAVTIEFSEAEPQVICNRDMCVP